MFGRKLRGELKQFFWRYGGVCGVVGVFSHFDD
jgi:hypothetical protein